MDTPSARPAHHLTPLIFVTIAAVAIVIVALFAALWTPVDPGLTVIKGPMGRLLVGWVAPDGRAWSAGIRPGETFPRRVSVADAASSNLTMAMRAGTTTVPSLLIVGLGLCFLLLGVGVLGKSPDRPAGRAYWRMSLCAGVALGLVPAGFHGLPWALGLQFVALRLFGPTLLDLTYASPGRRRSPMRPTRFRPLLWLPAVALLPLYPLCWWWPVPLFDLVQLADGLVLLGYGVASGARVMTTLRHSPSGRQQAQLQWFSLGLALGLTPFMLLSVLPLILIHRALVAPGISILALAALPVCVGIAIVRADFLGVVSLARRRTLRVALTVALLTSVAIMTGFIAVIGPDRWGWSAPDTAAAASIFAVLGMIALRPGLTRWAERLLLHDVYDVGAVMHQIGDDFTRAASDATDQCTIARLGDTLDLSFVLLLTPHDPSELYTYRNPRGLMYPARQDAVICRARAAFIAPPSAKVFTDDVDGQIVLFRPIWSGPQITAMLCCGPKCSEDCYTVDDLLLLDTLAYYFAFAFNKRHDRGYQEGARRDSAAGRESVSRGELRVLLLVAQGLSNREIAERLQRDPSTVQKHLAALRRKLGVHSPSDAVTVARREGLIPPEGPAHQAGPM